MNKCTQMCTLENGLDGSTFNLHYMMIPAAHDNDTPRTGQLLTMATSAGKLFH